MSMPTVCELGQTCFHPRQKDEAWDADGAHGCACDAQGYVFRQIEQQRRRRSNNGNDNTGGTAHKLQNGTEFHGCAFGVVAGAQESEALGAGDFSGKRR
jgi:hypothetical protein